MNVSIHTHTHTHTRAHTQTHLQPCDPLVVRLAQPLLLRQRGEQLRLLTLDARALLALDHHDLLELRVPLLERREPLRELDDLRGPPRFEPDRKLRAAILGSGISNVPLA
jgi:hypothetical protein